MAIRFAAGLFLVLASSPTFAGVTVSQQFVSVAAATATELNQAMDAWEPHGYWATTQVTLLHATFEALEAATGFTFGAVAVDLQIVQTFPDWQNLSDAPTCLQDQWRSTMFLIRQHEDDHSGSLSSYEDRLATALAVTVPLLTEGELQAIFDAAVKQVEAALVQEQASFDFIDDEHRFVECQD